MHTVDEETMVDVCLQWHDHEYRVFLENLMFPSFSKLMEAARRINESVRRTPRSSLPNHPSLVERPFPRKRPIVTAVEKYQEATMFSTICSSVIY